jgi:hypothetical protein
MHLKRHWSRFLDPSLYLSDSHSGVLLVHLVAELNEPYQLMLNIFLPLVLVERNTFWAPNNYLTKHIQS